MAGFRHSRYVLFVLRGFAMLSHSVFADEGNYISTSEIGRVMDGVVEDVWVSYGLIPPTITRLEAIASRLEAIALRLEAIASRLEAIAIRLECMV